MIAEKIMKLREEKRQHRIKKEEAKGHKVKEAYSRALFTEEEK